MARRKKEALEEAPPEEESRTLDLLEGLTDEEIFLPGRRWYVVHTYSGYEEKVKANLEQRIRSLDVGDLIFHVLLPQVEEI